MINWDDFDALSAVVPLLAKVYPNGQADINHFHAAGGTGYLFRQLLEAGLMYAEAATVWGKNFADYVQEPFLDDGVVNWRPGVVNSLDKNVLAAVQAPFANEGGLRLLQGNLGRAIIKVSAVAEAHRVVEAPAVVLASQHDLKQKFDAGELNRDCVVVVRFQGPQANGMPELHKLTPLLGVLQDRGFKVALITDGRMSGASGKVPAAIHLTPEAVAGGLIGKIRDGDVIRLDANRGVLNGLLSEAEFAAREAAPQQENSSTGVGRELFGTFRAIVSSAEEGATVVFERGVV